MENNIKSVIEKKMNDGTIEKLVEENFEKGINNALGKMFDTYGDLTKLVESKIKSVMVEEIEKYDYKEYVVKLDSVMTEIIKNASLDNKRILKNFKHLISDERVEKIEMSKIIDKYEEYVSKKASTLDLEPNLDDEPCYYVNITVEVIDEESRDWSLFEVKNVFFECGDDEDCNFQLKLRRYKEEKDWKIDYDKNIELSSLKYLDDFRLFITQKLRI
jgi:hypothetical protein